MSSYKKVSDQKFEHIKREVKMEHIATTITDHIQFKSKIEGIIEGQI